MAPPEEQFVGWMVRAKFVGYGKDVWEGVVQWWDDRPKKWVVAWHSPQKCFHEHTHAQILKMEKTGVLCVVPPHVGLNAGFRALPVSQELRAPPNTLSWVSNSTDENANPRPTTKKEDPVADAPASGRTALTPAKRSGGPIENDANSTTAKDTPPPSKKSKGERKIQAAVGDGIRADAEQRDCANIILRPMPAELHVTKKLLAGRRHHHLLYIALSVSAKNEGLRRDALSWFFTHDRLFTQNLGLGTTKAYIKRGADRRFGTTAYLSIIADGPTSWYPRKIMEFRREKQFTHALGIEVLAPQLELYFKDLICTEGAKLGHTIDLTDWPQNPGRLWLPASLPKITVPHFTTIERQGDAFELCGPTPYLRFLETRLAPIMAKCQGKYKTAKWRGQGKNATLVVPVAARKEVLQLLEQDMCDVPELIKAAPDPHRLL